MRKSDKYFITVLVGYCILAALCAAEVLHLAEGSLMGAWVATLALPVISPRAAKALEMEPYVWQALRHVAACIVARRQAG